MAIQEQGIQIDPKDLAHAKINRAEELIGIAREIASSRPDDFDYLLRTANNSLAEAVKMIAPEEFMITTLPDGAEILIPYPERPSLFEILSYRETAF